MKKIQVVAALIEKENKVLIAQRKCGEYANLWEFPGGKVEMNESDEDALKRELLEEMNVDVEVMNYIANSVYEYPNLIVNLKLYRVTLLNEKFVLNDHMEIQWVDENSILNYDLLPADIPLTKFLWRKNNG